MRRPFPFFAAVLASCVWASCVLPPARAHDPGLSGIRVLYRRADVVVNVTTAISRLARAENRPDAALTPDEMDRAVRRRLRLRLRLRAGAPGHDLVPGPAHVIADNRADVLSWQVVLPAPPNDIDVMARLYPEDPDARTVVAFVKGGQVVREALLDADHPALDRETPGALAMAARRYVRLGVAHILGGPDHVLFVLGLLLLGGTLRSLLRTVTAFTLAHSVTLTLAATGLVHPSPRLVEPLIALSLVAIAVENLRAQWRGEARDASPDRRPFCAFGFGLIHGFGFAGALAGVGLPPGAALGVALASFNAGVELGQAAILCAAFPGLALLAARRPALYRDVAVCGSLVIALAGALWFVTRLVAV